MDRNSNIKVEIRPKLSQNLQKSRFNNKKSSSITTDNDRWLPNHQVYKPCSMLWSVPQVSFFLISDATKQFRHTFLKNDVVSKYLTVKYR